MTIQTIAHGNTDEAPKNSYDQGFIDGELAAFEKLPARRATARAAMAEEFDPLYAQGYSDGYLAEIQRAYAYAQKEATQ